MKLKEAKALANKMTRDVPKDAPYMLMIQVDEPPTYGSLFRTGFEDQPSVAKAIDDLITFFLDGYLTRRDMVAAIDFLKALVAKHEADRID